MCEFLPWLQRRTRELRAPSLDKMVVGLTLGAPHMHWSKQKRFAEIIVSKMCNAHEHHMLGKGARPGSCGCSSAAQAPRQPTMASRIKVRKSKAVPTSHCRISCGVNPGKGSSGLSRDRKGRAHQGPTHVEYERKYSKGGPPKHRRHPRSQPDRTCLKIVCHPASSW